MVGLTLHTPGEHLYIRNADEQGFRIGDQRYTESIVISHDQLIDHWPPQTMSEISQEHIALILTLQPEVVLLGSGATQQFLEPRLTAHFYQNGVGIEVMTTPAASRTFNVLMSESRRAVAALLPLQPKAG